MGHRARLRSKLWGVDTLTGIKVFRQVVESGSFAAAADRLDLSPAMVSKHVMQAEKRLGVRLLNRNSRTLSLTELGRVYFERCKTILDDLAEWARRGTVTLVYAAREGEISNAAVLQRLLAQRVAGHSAKPEHVSK